MTSITPPAPDATANQFKRSIVLGNFAVCDRFQYYDASGTPSGTIIDKGSSVFYGNVTVKGTLEYSTLELTNVYTKTQIDDNFPTKERVILDLDSFKDSYYAKTPINNLFADIISGATPLTYVYNKTYIDELPLGTNYLTKTGTNLYYTGGNFGIGKVPTSKFDVEGDVKISGTFTLGNVLKYGGTSTGINMAINLTFPLDNYYYVYQNSIDGFLDIQLPDVHNQTIAPFQFTIVNMYAADTYGLVPYSSSASTPTFLYSKTGLQLASRNQVYNVSSSTSIFLTIHYFDKNWYLM